MRKLKESGIKWLGKIPKHWEVRKVKHIVKKIIGGGTPDTSISSYWATEKDNSYLWVSIEDITKSSFIRDTKKYITEDGLKSSSAKIAPPFSVLYSIYASLGKIAYSDLPITTNQAILAIQPQEILFYKFLFYYLHSATKNIITLSSMTTQNNISLFIVQNLKIPLPPLAEQKAIADFLDSKCAKIEEFISQKERSISLLKELKSSLINQTITQGLDNTTELKESGIKWLGKIPKHWEIKKLKYTSSLRNQKNSNGSLRIGLENIESQTGKFIQTDETTFEDEGIEFFKGDILFGKLRPYLAKVFLANQGGICVSEFLVLKSEKIYNRFLSLLMLSKQFINVVNGSTYGTKMPRANWDFIGNLKIPLPPLEEQKAIAQYLDERLSKIDLAIEKTQKEINLIKEYKTSLISEAVCGRIEIK